MARELLLHPTSEALRRAARQLLERVADNSGCGLRNLSCSPWYIAAGGFLMVVRELLVRNELSQVRRPRRVFTTFRTWLCTFPLTRPPDHTHASLDSAAQAGACLAAVAAAAQPDASRGAAAALHRLLPSVRARRHVPADALRGLDGHRCPPDTTMFSLHVLPWFSNPVRTLAYA